MAKRKETKKLEKSERDEKKIDKKEEIKVEEKESHENKKGEKERQNKILRGFLIAGGIIIVAIFIFFYFNNSTETFEYEGVNFSVVKFCGSGPLSCLTTYHTTLPVVYQNQRNLYNFYLRNDPRKLEKKVPFEGELEFRKNMVVKITFNQACQGFETIAVQNFLTLHQVAERTIISGENSSCDQTGNDMFVLIQEADRTYVEQIGPACYNINIKGCEILEGTERFMIESFVKINRELI